MFGSILQGMMRFGMMVASLQTTNTSGKYCKVSFPNDDHSAVTSSRSGYLISKWGKSPLFEHSINDCPYNSSGLRYYSYPDPTYNTVPPKPSVETFRKDNDHSFTAAVSCCDSRYNDDQYEWKSDYPRVIGLLLPKLE